MSNDMSIDKLLPQRSKPKLSKAISKELSAPHVPQTKEVDDTKSFKGVLNKYVDEVNLKQHEADLQVQKVASGESKDLHQVMLAMDEAETSFEMMMEVRNKLVDAYKELSRMQN